MEQLDERKRGYCVWLCQYNCGKKIKASMKELTQGQAFCDECSPKKNMKKGPIAENLAGQRFGKLQVLQRAENRKGRTAWLCQCDCGNETDVSEDGLVWGNRQSCGCRKEEAQEKISQQLTRIDGTCVEILEHRKYRSDNKSGFRGVFRKKDGKFRVSIGFKGERYNLGTYDTFEKAVSARLEAEHLIYGGFLKTYYEWKKMAEKNPGWEKDNPLLFEVEKIDGDIVIRQ